MENYLKFSVWVLMTVKRVTSETNMAELRAELPTTVNDVLTVMTSSPEGSKGFAEVFKLLEPVNNYDAVVNYTFSDSPLKLLRLTHDCLRPLSYSLMHWSTVHLMQILREYFDVAILLLKYIISVSAEGDVRILEAIRLRNEPEYCMLTAFYDWGEMKRDLFDANLLFETFYFLQTIAADPADPSSFGDLDVQLQSYSGRYDSMLKIRKTERLRKRFTAEPTAGNFARYSNALADMKKEIRDFSRAFCLSWTPFIGREILRDGAVTQSDYANYQQSPFVRHTFHHETCEIRFQTFRYEFFLEFPYIQKLAKNQQNQIISWRCDEILESREYRYQIYEASNGIIDKFFEITTNFISAGIALWNQQPFSMAALRDVLKSNPYYLNAVKYDNIVADVMLLAAIKEGNKMLRGIKLAVAKKCDKKPVELRGGEVRRMRSALHQFRSVLDRLVSLILDKRRINVADNRKKKKFDALVGSVMDLLDVQTDQIGSGQAERMCLVIPEELWTIENNGYIDHPLKFDSFYFNEPILNIRELYHFADGNGF